MENTDVLKIKGGMPLNGEVAVYGAKNAISKILVAALLTDQECVLRNVSYVVDTELMMSVLTSLGAEVEDDRANRTIRVTAKNIHGMEDAKFHEVVGKSRVPILLCGPLLARMGEAVIPALGGCVIGDRPVDFHIAALRKLGAEVKEKSDGIYFKAKNLAGCQIRLDYPSVGATEQVLLSAVFAQGTTELSNAAVEPEIQDLVSVLNQMGANIVFSGERTYIVHGVQKLNGFDHYAISDRLEAASWACAAAATGGNIFVRNANSEHLRAFLEKFEEAGGEFAIKDDGIGFWRGKELAPVRIETGVYPGFATDWQQPFAVLLTQSRGESIVHETVYENRFGYTAALNQMGANIELIEECRGTLCRFNQLYLHSAIIHGPTALHAEQIEVPDLRGGFSYVIAALIAKGVTEISNVKLLKRGYENFVEKITCLGAEIVDDLPLPPATMDL
ncbi:MAG: UDP-N-acetylglucosamine 1-carboxyvinyltransferase [Candidatus Blackburnbacteria bacterium]|nr:UDP-N-acetylglucosamine 1-carboxyvinyltransferase [Candidatus Blackburnbacteria bacterium]